MCSIEWRQYQWLSDLGGYFNYSNFFNSHASENVTHQLRYVSYIDEEKLQRVDDYNIKCRIDADGVLKPRAVKATISLKQSNQYTVTLLT